MPKIDNYVTFVKEQVTVQERLAQKYDEDNYRSGIHFKSARAFADLARFLEDIQKRGTQDIAYLNRGDTPQKRILLTFEEIENAPEELLKELNLTENDRQELLIEHIIAQADGVLSLDKIIMELYTRTREVPKRTAVTQRLFRMASRGMIYNVPGKKGIYSTYELSEADAKKMFGQFDEGQAEETAAAVPAPSASAAAASPKLDLPLRKRFLESSAGIRKV
jgi:Fe2+ or Zn2+ uptake regulation protein